MDPVDNPKTTKASKATQALAAEVATEVDAGTPQNTPAADEHQGVGGLYEMVDGKRQLVSRTQVAPA